MEQVKQLAIILAFAVCAALLFGSIGFVAGFFGPMLIAVLVDSEANLGPLWGLFILGPGGLILGFFVGAFIGYKKIRNK